MQHRLSCRHLRDVAHCQAPLPRVPVPFSSKHDDAHVMSQFAQAGKLLVD